jgi:hypothetical protein
MLTPSNTSATNTILNPRQIAVITSTSGLVMYTVPAGKKFVGYIYGYTSGVQYTITPSGGTAITQVGGGVSYSNTSVTPFQLVLVAGTIITNNSTNAIYLNGIESDL